MRRRAFVTGLGGTLIAWPLASFAQQPERCARIGIIDDAPIWDNFRQRLRELGDIEGQNVAIEYRTADGNPERLLAAARELAAVPVNVIAIYGSVAAKAAQAATAQVPIVAISIGDPVRIGLVNSLARPGGNITGNTILGPDLVPKRLQLLKEVLPQAMCVAFLWNPNNESNRALFEELQSAAPKLDVVLVSVEARTAEEIDQGLQSLVDKRPDALMTTNDPLHRSLMAKVIDFQFAHSIPGMFQIREQVVVGSLMSYGASLPDLFRRGAHYVHRILHGALPADLPIEQPVKFDLAINLKTAKALGLTVPPSILVRADEIIE